MSTILDPQDEKYLLDALHMALLSPDPSTQNGAVIVRGDIVSTGCNDFPHKVKDFPARWERPMKYLFVEHAERSAIFEAAKLGVATNWTTMYCPWFACADCARAIIQAGINRIVGLADYEGHDRWVEQNKVGDVMFGEAGVEVVRGKLATPCRITLRRNDKLITL